MFALIGHKIPDRGMDSFSIVKARNVLKNLLLGFFPGFEFVQVNEFFFQHVVERFNTGVIVAIALTAHVARHAVLS